MFVMFVPCRRSSVDGTAVGPQCLREVEELRCTLGKCTRNWPTAVVGGWCWKFEAPFPPSRRHLPERLGPALSDSFNPTRRRILLRPRQRLGPAPVRKPEDARHATLEAGERWSNQSSQREPEQPEQPRRDSQTQARKQGTTPWLGAIGGDIASIAAQALESFQKLQELSSEQL
jgi:hypothetical protein